MGKNKKIIFLNVAPKSVNPILLQDQKK